MTPGTPQTDSRPHPTYAAGGPIRGFEGTLNVPASATVNIDTTDSPRWLRLWRDIALATAATLFCILVLGSALLGAFALARVGNALDDVSTVQLDPTPTSDPCFITGDPTCVQPGD